MTRLPEPWKVKVVEPIRLPSRSEREQHLRAAGFNLFSIPADAVFIDLLTDSGTAAMSQNQWAGMMTGDESYAGARSFYRLEETVREIFGLEHVLPVHQGRAGERLVFSEVVQPGMVVPSNHHFDTTRANVEMAGGNGLDLGVEAAHDLATRQPFKGDMDLVRLARFLEQAEPGRVPLVMMTVTNNSVGGQPVSLANLAGAAEICRDFGIPLWIDASRFAENAWLIREREAGQRKRSLRSIVREMFSHADGLIMSAKKDGLVNIGGFVATRDGELAERLKQRMVVTEGFPTYGGLAGRDLEALAVGLGEVLEDAYLAQRIEQVRGFGEALTEAGVPIVQPVGGHAVYIDAAAMLPHVPREQLPAQALTVALYREGGVRGVEIGTVMFGDVDAVTGRVRPAHLELVRLAVPRRAYSDRHLSYVADVVAEIHEHREDVRGMMMTHVPPVLRHFTARFEEVGGELPLHVPAAAGAVAGVH